MTNPIIDEVRAARAALAAEHDYDIARITEWARQQTEVLKKVAKRPSAGHVRQASPEPAAADFSPAN